MEISYFHIFISDLVLIITLIILIWQTWLLKKSIISNTVQSIYRNYLEIDKLIVEHPEFQKYIVRKEIYPKIESLQEEELRKKSFIELVLDLCELIYYQKKAGVFSGEITYIDRVLTNPYIKDYWKTVRGTFKADFVEYVEKVLSKHEKSGEDETV
jgi:hypothetical protein